MLLRISSNKHDFNVCDNIIETIKYDYSGKVFKFNLGVMLNLETMIMLRSYSKNHEFNACGDITETLNYHSGNEFGFNFRVMLNVKTGIV